MQAHVMSPMELLVLILGVSAIVVIFCTIMFLFFRRFLNREQELGETFRTDNKPQP
ncbi:MAG: hypothetical protein ACAH95_10690 [Fimbriimonas sp.]